jgi:dTMP kinase
MPAMSGDHGWLTQLAGKFIVFDGPDGSGKTTQFRRFAQLVRSAGLTVCEVREPGGTAIGEQIRQVLLDPDHDEMALRCEMMLYMASRAQLVAEKIRPAKQRGELVLADRFVSSTLAYQGTAGGMDVKQIMSVARVAIGDCWPDLVVIFDVDERAAAMRLNPLLDRMEAKGAAYHARVRRGYLDQADADPDRHLVIDATPDAQAVFANLCEQLKG